MLIPEPSSSDLDRLIDRFLGGETTPAEERALRAWATSRGASEGALDELRRAAAGVRSAERPDARLGDIPHVRWETIVQAIAGQESARREGDRALDRETTGVAIPRHRDGTVPGAVGVRSSWVRPFMLGGAALLACGALAVLHVRSGSRVQAPSHRTYVTATGQQAVVTLDDGTRVTLAPRTTLRVMAFGSRARTLALDGEAYFKVAPEAGAPFVVQAGDVRATVLGTGFMVRHYAGDRHTRVMVTTGKVAVAVASASRVPQASMTLTAGWAADVTDSSATTAIVDDAAIDTAWMDGHLVFYQTRTADVLRALTQWYGYRFRLTDSTLARQRLTTVLSTQSSADALGTLKLLLDVDFSFDGDVVTLVPRHGAQVQSRMRHDLLRHDPLVTRPRAVGR